MKPVAEGPPTAGAPAMAQMTQWVIRSCVQAKKEFICRWKLASRKLFWVL